MAEPLEELVAGQKDRMARLRAEAARWFASAREAATPVAYRDALVAVRAIQDTLEEHVALAISVRGATARAAADAKEAYEADWAQQASAHAASGVRRGEEMEGPRERYARFDVRVFPQLRAWKAAERVASTAAEMLEEAQLRYRAVNATREDLHAVLRSYAFESSIDRGA